jgi:hypothetical protein
LISFFLGLRWKSYFCTLWQRFCDSRLCGANASTSWLDTGITASLGSAYQFSVINPATLWSAGSDIPFPRSSTADGINPAFYGTNTQDGFTANFGALVGEDGTQFFLIGTGPIAITGLSGDFKVG